MNDIAKICISDAMKLEGIPIYKSQCLENFEAMRFCLGRMALTVTRRMTGSMQ